MAFRGALVVSLACCAVVSAAVSSTGFTVELGGVSYFLPPKAVATIAVDECKSLFANTMFAPFTVVHGSGSADMESATAKYLEEDDVFQEGFLEGMFMVINISRH
jgi:hypothetical protein